MGNVLIDRNTLVGKDGLFFKRGCPGNCQHCNLWTEDGCRVILEAPTVDAVEVSRLGELGRLMTPYSGCPRGRMGPRVDGGITELDPIEDIEGDRWVPVLEDDLNRLKANAVEVVHGRMEEVDIVPNYMWKYRCGCCHSYGERWHNYCPNCGAKMDL